jgi:hypothetical protein
MKTVSLGLVWVTSSGAKLTRPAMRAFDTLGGEAGWALMPPEGADWALARPGANRSRAWAKALSKALMSSDWGGKLARTRSQY